MSNFIASTRTRGFFDAARPSKLLHLASDVTEFYIIVTEQKKKLKNLNSRFVKL
jgi:hypothetical protein